MIVKISLFDILNFLFLVNLPAEICLFLNSGSKTLKKSSIEQKNVVILSVEITSIIPVNYLCNNNLYILIFLIFMENIID